MIEKQKIIKKKIMPHSEEAEEAVLACLLLNNDTISNMYVLKPEDFYFKNNQTIFIVMNEIVSNNKPLETINLINELKNKGELEQIGGTKYILHLTDLLPNTELFLHYCQIIKKNSNLRKLILSTQQINDLAYSGDATEAINYAEKEIFALSETFDTSKVLPFHNALNAALNELQKLGEDPLKLRGVPTPFKHLNVKIGGFQKGDLLIVAARPGQGKTSLAMNFISHAALCNNRTNVVGEVKQYSCAVFSLEMPSMQLAKRMLCSVANVSLEKANNGKLTQSEWKKLTKAKSLLDNAKIWIDDSAVITPYEILSKCRRIKRQYGLDLVMIDYLQLMTIGQRTENRQLEVSQITRTLKIAAKDLDVPIILLSQLSREIEKRQGKRPQMSDLRESGAIEQDADIIIFIYKEENRVDNIVELMVAKHRNGSPGNIKVIWKGDTVSFYDYDISKDIQSLEKTAPTEEFSNDNFIINEENDITFDNDNISKSKQDDAEDEIKNDLDKDKNNVNEIEGIDNNNLKEILKKIEDLGL